ncbi:MAG: SdpI family protein [Kiritimatiellia bacterium]
MDSFMILGWSNVLVGGLGLLLGIPLWRRKIPMNRWYGARFKKSFESEDNRYRINEHSGKQLMLWSVPLLAIGAAALAFPGEPGAGWADVLAFTPLLLCVPCLLSYRFARKL